MARADTAETCALDVEPIDVEPIAWPREHAGTRARGADRLEALDALRGVMALAVATYHLTVWTHALEGPWRAAAIVFGIYSVQGFFIISGFCFFKLYGHTRFDRPQLWRFHLRRFARIAPLFYVAIAGSYLIGQPVNPAAGWDRLLENLTLSFGLFHPNHALVLGGWSIGLEYVFYLVFPLLAWLTQRRLALYVLAAAAIACALPYNFERVAAANRADQFNVYVQCANHAFLFLLGGVIADLHRRSASRLPAPIALAAIAILWWAALSRQPEIVEHLDVMIGWARVRYVVLCFATVGLCAFGLASRVVWAPLRKLGELSYSVYLIHPFGWFITARILPAASPTTQLLSGLLVTLALSACTRRWIELPAIALGRRYSSAPVHER